VTISPGLYMPNWRSSQGPGAWWANSTIKADGVENISLDHTNSPDTPTSGIFFFGCDGCWVKNVRSLNAGRNHVWLYETNHTVVRDSYFYGTKNAASQSYGIETFMSSDNLVENNIFQHITTSIQGNGSASGTVFGYNYSVDDFYNVSPNWMQPANELHAAGTDMILFEGNVGAAFETDDVHGTHNFTTLFRNYYLGWETGKAAQTIPVQLYAWSRYFNVIGNVLGKPGYHTQYQSIPSASTNANSAIFVLGWANNEGTSGSAGPDDSLTASTLMRWGNYDTANNAVRWNTSETASTLSQYASLVPSSQILPPSFYLSSKPAFWGSMPWPAIGPDVTGGSDPSGHAYTNPAQACYNSTAAASGILTFNATKCYTGGSSTTSAAPAPPTNLTATPN
jgi:Right handed beta helix region